MWTQFWDMYSGGDQKEKWAMIYIEAPEDEAKIIFYNRFGHNCERVTCTCCGEDYSLDEDESLEQLTAYHRGCMWQKVAGEKGQGHYIEKHDPTHSWDKYRTLEEYAKDKKVLIIHASDIKEEERRQGYVWQD